MLKGFRTSRASGTEVFSWCLYDFANSAFATTILAVIFNRYYASVVAGGATGVEIPLFFTKFHLHGTALFNFIVAIAMLIVAIASPILGAWADSRASKKQFLMFFIILGVVSTAMLATVDPGEWRWGAFWFILADVGFAGGNVFYNAFLRDLAAPSESGKVSGWGWGIGYLGGGLLLVINLVMLKSPQLLGFPEGTFTLHHTFISVALWWGLFSIPLLVHLRERSVVSGTSGSLRNAFSRLRTSFHEIKRFRQLWRFLLAYLLFNDGIETVIIMASIFGDQELKMGQSQLIVYFLMIQITAFFGSVLFGKLTEKHGNMRMLISSLLIWCLVVIAAFFTGWSGRAILEYYIIGIIAGTVMGASQSIARGIQAEFTPRGREAEFFGFFAVSGRFASLFGPLTYGLVVALTGSLRAGILSLLGFFIVGTAILFFVDEREGREAAGK